MQALLGLCRGIDGLTERVGRAVGWLLLAAVLISTGNAIIRKAFSMSSNAFLEAQWYLFAAVFLLGAGYVFLHDQHVRIDAVSGRFSRRVQVAIDVVGIVVFLLPLCVFIMVTSWPSVLLAFQTGEVSANPGGLLRWPMYALVPVGFALLALQSASELIKRLAFLAGRGPDPHAKPEVSDEERLLEEMRQETAARERAAAAAPQAEVAR